MPDDDDPIVANLRLPFGAPLVRESSTTEIDFVQPRRASFFHVEKPKDPAQDELLDLPPISYHTVQQRYIPRTNEENSKDADISPCVNETYELW